MAHIRPQDSPSKRVLMLLSNGFAPDPRVYKEARTLVAAGFDVRVFCMSRSPGTQPREQTTHGISVVRFEVGHVRSGRLVDVYLHLRRFYREVERHVIDVAEPFDVIHAHDLDTLELGLALKRRGGVPLVYDAHEFFPGYTPNRALNLSLYVLESVMAHSVDAFIHAAPERARLFRRWHPTTRGKSHVVLNNYPALAEDFDKTALERSTRIIFQYQGMLNSARCVQEIVEAVAALSAAERAKLELHLYGAVDGLYAEALRTFIVKHALQGTVLLKGHVPYPSLLEATRKTDVGLVSLRPTHANNIHAAPNKLYDYIACKNIVIAQATSELAAVVERDALGLVCDFRDVRAITRAIREVLELRDLRDRQEVAFRAHRERYNWEAQQERLVELYRRLLS